MRIGEFEVSDRYLNRLKGGSLHAITSQQFEAVFGIKTEQVGFGFVRIDRFVSGEQTEWWTSDITGVVSNNGPFGGLRTTSSLVIGDVADDMPMVIDYQVEIPRVLAVSDDNDSLHGEWALVAPSVDEFLDRLGLE